MSSVADRSSEARVTVVISAYDQVWSLREAVDSALAGAEPVRCIIVVDACPHGTGEVASQLAAEHPDQVTAIELARNVGQSGARNAGLSAASTELVLFLDGDDRLVAGALDSVIERQRTSGADLVLARLRLIDEDGDPLPPSRYARELFEHVVLRRGREIAAPLTVESLLTQYRVGTPGTWLLSAEALRQAGGFNPTLRYWDDLEMMVRLLPVLRRVVEDETVLLEYRQHGAQQSRDAVLQHTMRFRAAWSCLRTARDEDHRSVVRGVRSLPRATWRRARKMQPTLSHRVKSAVIWAWLVPAFAALPILEWPVRASRGQRQVRPLAGAPDEGRVPAAPRASRAAMVMPLYAIWRTPWPTLVGQLRQAAAQDGVSAARLAGLCVGSMLRDGVLPMDFLLHEHWRLNPEEVSAFATTLQIHELHRAFNDRDDRSLVRDKLQFHSAYAAFATPDFLDLRHADPASLDVWARERPRTQIAIKNPRSSSGKGVRFVAVSLERPGPTFDGMGSARFLRSCRRHGFLLAEGIVEQHEILSSMNPDCLNTARITTLLRSDGTLDYLCATIRVGLDKPIDNFGAGGIAALVDLATGVVIGPAIRRDPNDTTHYLVHPFTGCPLVAVELPWWPETLSMIERAARVVPTVRTVGWDVAFTPTGPLLVEANDNWDKASIETALDRGIAEDIERWSRLA